MDEYAKSVAEFHGIEVAVPTSARKRRLPKRFEECVPLSVLMPLAEMYSFDKEVLEMEGKLAKWSITHIFRSQYLSGDVDGRDQLLLCGDLDHPGVKMGIIFNHPASPCFVAL